MTKRRAIIAVAILLAGLLALAVTRLLPGLLDPYRLPPHDWTLFKKRFLAPEGRIVDDGNGNVSHSEGQGYGLLIAAAYHDRKSFDLIWDWTRKNLQTRPHDKLMSWKWAPDGHGGGAVADPNNASDGDLLVAWALLRASSQWQEYRYQQAALQILADLAKLDVVQGDDGPILLPGADGFVKDGITTVNPSYYVFPALAAMSHLPNSPWKDLAQGGAALIGKARFGKWDLAPDWLQVGTQTAISPDFPPLFGYNAVRIPLYAAWQNPASPLMQPFAKFWQQFLSPTQIPATVNLETDTFGKDPALPGMRAVARLAQACVAKQSLTVAALPELTEGEPYYSASLNLLTKIALRESRAQK